VVQKIKIKKKDEEMVSTSEELCETMIKQT
jgi:hypothetical protein